MKIHERLLKDMLQLHHLGSHLHQCYLIVAFIVFDGNETLAYAS